MKNLPDLSLLRRPLRSLRGMWTKWWQEDVIISLSNGMSLRGDVRHPSWARVRRRGAHEPATDQFLACFLRNGDIVVDVGAHIGIVTAIASRCVGSKGRVHAIEVDEQNLCELEATIRRNRLLNVCCHATALAKGCRLQNFVRPQASWGAFAVDEFDEWNESPLQQQIRRPGDTRRFQVETISLEQFMEREAIREVQLIKIDVDGCEYEILQGGMKAIKQFRPIVIYEHSQFSRRVIENVPAVWKLFSEIDYEMCAAERESPHVRPIQCANDAWLQQLIVAGSDVNLFCRPKDRFADRWERAISSMM